MSERRGQTRRGGGGDCAEAKEIERIDLMLKVSGVEWRLEAEADNSDNWQTPRRGHKSALQLLSHHFCNHKQPNPQLNMNEQKQHNATISSKLWQSWHTGHIEGNMEFWQMTQRSRHDKGCGWSEEIFFVELHYHYTLQWPLFEQNREMQGAEFAVPKYSKLK